MIFQINYVNGSVLNNSHFTLLFNFGFKESGVNASGPPLALGTNVPGDVRGGSWRSLM